MFGSLSLLPGLAVAGVTTSVSLVTAMGGVQSLPQVPDKPAIVRSASTPADESVVMGATALRVEQPVDEPDVATAAPAPPAAPTSAPTPASLAPAVTVVSKPATTSAPAPARTSAPAPASQCTTWLYQGWTVTWCAPATAGGVATWSVTNGTTTYSGTYNMTTGAYTGTYPNGWSSNWGTSGGKHGHK